MNFEKIELIFIIVEMVSIFIEIGLQIFEIKSSKEMEKKIINKIGENRL